MKISRDAIIAGQPIAKLRAFAGDVMRGDYFYPSDVEKHFGADITATLLEAGLIEWYERKRKPFEGEPDTYQMTRDGAAFSTVKFIPRISRQKADRIVTDLLGRARQINDDPEAMLRISEIRIFGSYITNAIDLGDIDVVITLERRKPPAGMDWTDWNFKRANASGRNLSFIQRLTFGEEETRKRLRNRERYLSFHQPDELERLGCPSKRVFPT